MLEVKTFKQELDYKDVLVYVNRHKMEIGRKQHLKDYYDNKTMIKYKQQTDPSKPCNRISNPYCSYISDTITGYFMNANAVSYQFEDSMIGDKFNDIQRYNDESAHNTALALDCSIYGCACELLYLDETLMPRYKRIDPLEVIMIYDCTVDENPVGAIRHFKIQDYASYKEKEYVEYYTKDTVHYFYADEENNIQSIRVMEHFFQDVPLNIYKNNNDLSGDFEKVIDIIDAYNSVQSMTLDDIESISNSILLISGVALCDEIVKNIREMRLLNILDNQGKAEYLTKEIPDTEQYKSRLLNDLFTLSSVPNMNDENFGNNLSGVSIQFKLSNLEMKCAIKESFFKKALLRRLELMANVIGLLGSIQSQELIKDVQIKFERNKIDNTNEVINQAIQLSSILSKESTLALLSEFILSVDDEMQKLDTEREENMTMFNSYGSHDFKTEDGEQEDKEEEVDGDE